MDHPGASYTHPLWEYEPRDIPTDMLMTFVAHPCLVLLFFTWFPREGVRNKALYVAVWACLYDFLEWTFKTLFHLFQHFHGWSIWHSLWFDFVMFLALRLHLKRPLLTYMFSAAMTVFLLIVFHVPVSKMK